VGDVPGLDHEHYAAWSEACRTLTLAFQEFPPLGPSISIDVEWRSLDVLEWKKQLEMDEN
jgi:hypothetical protein